MKRTIFIILSLFLVFMNSDVIASQQNVMKKEYKAVSVDGFNIQGVLSYPKVKGQKEYNTVVLLHSLGYNSQWWGDLPRILLDKGYAVLAIDLRGHGYSVYNSKLAKVSWKSLTNNAYTKYPDDVIAMIDVIKEDNVKRDFFTNWAIVGCDIGASAGVLAADRLPEKPKTIVMISPVVKAKGLYIPVSVAQLGNTDFLSISSQSDLDSIKSSAYLKKFAQREFSELYSESKTSGNLMFKNDSKMSTVVAEWIGLYFN